MRTKILSLLLLLASAISFSQGIITPVDQLKIRYPVAGTSQTKVVSIDATTGLTGSILKTDLIEVLEYANFSSFPGTGVVGKIYVDKALNKLYRWTSSAYVELSSSTDSQDLQEVVVQGDQILGANGKTTISSLGGTIDVQNLTGTKRNTLAFDIFEQSNSDNGAYFSIVDGQFLGSLDGYDFILQNNGLARNFILGNFEYFSNESLEYLKLKNLTIKQDNLTAPREGQFQDKNYVGVADITDIHENQVKILEASPDDEFAFAHGTVTIGSKMFIGTRQGTDSKLLRYNGTTLEESITIPCESFKGVDCITVNSSNNRIYGIRKYSGVSYIFDVDPEDFTDINYNVISGVNLADSPAIVTDDTYIYGVTNLTPPTFFKIRISDWVTITTNTWTSRNSGHASKINIAGGVYYCTSQSNWFAKVNLLDLSYSELDLNSYISVATDDLAYIPDDVSQSGLNLLIIGGEAKNAEFNKIGAVCVDATNMVAYPFEALPSVGWFFNSDYSKLYNTSVDGFIEEYDFIKFEYFVLYGTPSEFRNTYTYRGLGFPNELLFPTGGDIYMTNWDTTNATSQLSKIELTPFQKALITERESYFRNLNTSGNLELGETSTTAYRGDRGKIAYDHSQIITGNPHNTTATDVDALKRDGSNVNSDVDLGTYSLNAKSLHVKGTAGNGHLGLKHQSATITASASESSLGADASGNPVWKNDGNALQNVMLENSSITGATKTKITYDAKGLVTAGADLSASDMPSSIDAAKINTGAVSNTEFNYLDGVTSSIQTQIDSKADKSLGAYKMRANNTNATANGTEQVFKSIAQQAYTGSITWTATTAPSGATNHTYSWMQIGNMVTVTISLNYASAGTSCTAVVFDLPSDCPTPIKVGGRTAASEKQYNAIGWISPSSTTTTNLSVFSVLRSNAANTGFEFMIMQGTNSSKVADITCTYFVN